MLSVIAAPIARLKGARLVNWLQDLFPEVAEAVGVGANPLMRGFYGLLRSLRDASLLTASMNVVLGERMAERVAAAGVQAITIIPNWSDGREIRPVARSENVLRNEWGLDGRFVVGYSGNLGRAHEYRTLIDAIALIEETAPAHPQAEPVVWLFIGGGALYDGFREEVAARALTSVVFKPYQPRERLSESLSAADVHLVSLKPELEGLIVPSKFYGVAAVGRPTVFIGDPHGEIATVVARHDCGLSVAEGNSRALADAILALATDLSRREAMGTNARRAFETHYDKQVAFDAWRKVLSSVEDRP
jgi:glycosyltransferase involved in cell wall biosynthesis